YIPALVVGGAVWATIYTTIGSVSVAAIAAAYTRWPVPTVVVTVLLGLALVGWIIWRLTFVKLAPHQETHSYCGVLFLKNSDVANLAAMNDAEISAAATLQPISDIAATVNINDEALIPYGHHMAKVYTEKVQTSGKRGKLVLVTAVSPTPAGEGKSTVSVGIAEALNLVGSNTMVALREPSLGPVFGMKGGATGGGYAQVVPMENI